MNDPTLTCQDDQRRREVRRRQLNGLDYLDVSDDQLMLKVYFLGHAPEGLTKDNVSITGGRRIRDIQVTEVKICPQVDPELDNCMVVTVDKPGDFSCYRLCLVNLPPDNPFDPRYRCLDFSFKVGCPSELDCKAAPVCPPKPLEKPEINYLAKDYASFRQLILDRLALLVPDWKERHVPDLGITLVELLAYAGDYLSYYQDAVATEAYLGTARRRISVRRHALLMDYRMHEGCNARAWVHVGTTVDQELEAGKIAFITGLEDLPQVSGRLLTWDDLRNIPSSRYEVFEPLAENPQAPILLHRSHNEILFYTWGDRQCCLPQGATSATLVDGPPVPPPDQPQDGPEQHPGQEDADDAQKEAAFQRELKLEPGDILIFEEVLGPKTGNPADADPSRRHAVRLTQVDEASDPLYGQPVLEIAWAEEDALPFPLCLSTIGPAPECKMLEDVSLARGNVLLVDHGRSLDPKDLGCVPYEEADAACKKVGLAGDVTIKPGRFRPVLQAGPLTFGQPLKSGAAASEMIAQDPRQALPFVRLTALADPECLPEELRPQPPAPQSDYEQKHAEESPPPAVGPTADSPAGTWWDPRLDLLDSSAEDRHFVVEVDSEGRGRLRFGDGELGRRPEVGTRFEALCRVGNGPAGNVGAESILHPVTRDVLSGVELNPRNPLPARGGTAAEAIEKVKLFAPHAFRRQLERAITPGDYAELVMREFAGKVQRAAAVLRWTGSWYEVLVAVDPLGSTEPDEALLQEIKQRLYRYRRIGHDLSVQPAQYVPLNIVMSICVEDGFLRGHVKAALLDRFSNRQMPDGAKGFFHPDNLSFGDGIKLSKLVAAAQAVPGVQSVRIKTFQRLFEEPSQEIENGLLPLGPLEVARLDNDPSFPENGQIDFEMRGGR